MCSLCIALCSYPVFALPDFTKLFCIESDASDNAVGGVLTQEHVPDHKHIAFLSKTLTSCERNYSVHDYELLSIVTYCKAWCSYINRQQTIGLTDHKALIHLQT